MVQQSPRRLELTVTADQAGEKIDTLLRRELRLSGTVIRRVKWLDDGILWTGCGSPPPAARRRGRCSPSG